MNFFGNVIEINYVVINKKHVQKQINQSNQVVIYKQCGDINP